MNPSQRLLPLLVLATCAAAQADVSYQEEVINSGVGPNKRGARRTVNEVCIKGPRQRVTSDIETSKEMTKVLQQQGKTLQGTTILLLDQARVYDINRATGTFRQQPLPAARPAPPPGAAKPAAAPDPNREIAFRTRSLPDTLRIAGIRCQRVAAEMTARQFKPGTKDVVRVNRYLYQAWVASDFPGYGEIESFRRLQEQKTSLPPLVRGGLDQLGDAVDDPERLQAELEALQGFPLQSELKVFTQTAGAEERQIFQLTRKVLRLDHQALADTLFRPSQDLKQVQ